MLLSCPACAARYRLDPARHVGKRLSIRCPACQYVFVVSQTGSSAGPAIAVIVATGNAGLAKALGEQCHQSRLPYMVRSDGTEAIRALKAGLPAILLLDVALTGCYAFDVIKFVRNQPKGAEVRILLLTSSFRRDSFIAKTMDLHGADDSFDGAALAAMPSAEFSKFINNPRSWGSDPVRHGGEGSEPNPVLWNQATNLAKVVAADIVLRYQDLLEESARTGVLAKALVEGLAKARQLFSTRMGEDFAGNYDFVGAALAVCLQTRNCQQDRDSNE